MAKYVLLVVNDESFRQRPEAELDGLRGELERWSEEMTRRGVLKGGRELDNKSSAMTVRRVDGAMKVFDGPFIETKEHVGGFMVVEAPDLDAAISAARSFPADVEIRPVVEH